ncbi:acyltransferase [Lysobacter sp.]|uniref:acyltransferase family protein n=1 Tax=Lysobacter sp. TaxID=72226 RepID=UPI002D294E3A|nr:acyltransferase [Lysobacter sp.]HZX78225.1 acyltransferase [Lysobacter sp.]
MRALAALLVVLFHLRIVEGKYGAGSPFLPGWIGFADGGVDLFFVISGFVMATIAAGSYRSRSNATTFLLRRAWRILPLYWGYTTVVVLLMAIIPGAVNTSYQGQSIPASYLLWPQATLPVLTVGWTLIHEGYFYLVMAFAIACLPERAVPALLAIWALVVGVGPHLLEARSPGLDVLLSSMTWEFIAGVAVGLYWRRIPAVLGLPLLLLGAIGFVAGMIALGHLSVPGLVPNRVAIFGLTSALMIAGAVVYESGRGSVSAPVWQAIGDSSYSLYLSHVFVISAVGRLWKASAFNVTAWEHGLFVLFATLLSLAVGLASYRWLERPLLVRGRSFIARTAARLPLRFRSKAVVLNPHDDPSSKTA